MKEMYLKLPFIKSQKSDQQHLANGERKTSEVVQKS